MPKTASNPSLTPLNVEAPTLVVQLDHYVSGCLSCIDGFWLDPVLPYKLIARPCVDNACLDQVLP